VPEVAVLLVVVQELQPAAERRGHQVDATLPLTRPVCPPKPSRSRRASRSHLTTSGASPHHATFEIESIDRM
jgi:hypothetical protein